MRIPKKPYKFLMIRACQDKYGKFKGFIYADNKETITQRARRLGLKPFGKTIILKVV